MSARGLPAVPRALLAAGWLLSAAAGADAPPLPAGLGGGSPVESSSPGAAEDSAWRLESDGFVEARLGARAQRDPNERRASLEEVRLHYRQAWLGERADLALAADLLADALSDKQGLDLEAGEGPFDLREASLAYRAGAHLDLKLGRQVLTWGTGDLIFINDLFPKDFRSFFLGRDEDYLKAPSDALKLSIFSGLAHLDVVYTPRFDADRYIDGRSLSFFDPAAGTRVGRGERLRVRRPDDWLDDDELALRLYRNLAGYELAAYAYHGFWKSPAGRDPASGRALFPELTVYGASLRGAFAGGIGSLELGYYDSRDDRDGDDPFVRNGELRLLLGYEREVARETTLGLQYYLEHRLEQAAHRRALPPGQPEADQDRHVVTVRLTRLALRQDLRLSLFAFYSPSDRDGLVLARARYRLDDQWAVEGGANVFTGRDPDTFFGQLERNSSLFLAIRYGFGA